MDDQQWKHHHLWRQDEAARTLEFVQRCLIGVNPKRGTKARQVKVSKKTGKLVQKNAAMECRVATLIKNFMDFEWLSHCILQCCDIYVTSQHYVLFSPVSLVRQKLTFKNALNFVIFNKNSVLSSSFVWEFFCKQF